MPADTGGAGEGERPIEPLERVIHDAIHEWRTIEGGPGGGRHEPTMAHYITVKVRDFVRALKDWADV